MAGKKPTPPSWQDLAELVRVARTPDRCSAISSLLARLLPQSTRTACWIEDVYSAMEQPSPTSQGDSPQERTVPLTIHGVIRGGLSVTVPAVDVPSADALLLVVGQILERQVEQEQHQQRLTSWQELATLGEAAGRLVHDLNNHLGSMVLQAACLQMSLEGKLRQQAEVIRQEGLTASATLRAVQSVRVWKPRNGETADLGLSVRAALAELPELDGRIEHTPPSDDVRVACSPGGLERLLWLLLRIAGRCVSPGLKIPVMIEQEPVAGIRIALPGVQPRDGEGWDRLPEEMLGGVPELERAAARTLARQMIDRTEFEPTADGLNLAIRWAEPPLSDW